MNDTERDELLRWAAEDVLGWTLCVVACPDDGEWAKPHWHDERWIRFPRHLLGWPSFGLAVEAARKLDMIMTLQIISGSQLHFVDISTPDERWEAEDEDPALAAWAALREAIGVKVPA